jgi:hypothetical protein
MVHSGLLAVSLLALPIVPTAAWKPIGTEDPLWRILGLLVASVGARCFLLSATSPLVQSWFARRQGGALPYRLFALSNLASLAALLAYPVIADTKNGDPLQSASEWVLIARDEEPFAHPALSASVEPLLASNLRPWTDDYNNLLQVLR